MQDDNELLICNNNKLCNMFVRANVHILKHYSKEILKKSNKFKALEYYWMKTFGAKLLKDDHNHYYKIIFNTQKHFILFKIKFS
jgi:hypothetical protein